MSYQHYYIEYIQELYLERILKFYKQAGISRCYFLNGSFYELPTLYVFENQTQKLCNTFCDYWSEMLCAHVYVPPIRAIHV